MEGPLRNRFVALLNLHRAWRLVWSAAPRWTLYSAVLVIVQGVLPLVSLVLLKQVVDTLGVAIAEPAKGAYMDVALWIGLVGLVAIITVCVGSLSALVNQAQSLVVTDHVANLLHEKSIAVDLGFYEDASFCDTLHLAQQEAPHRPARIVNGVTQTLQNFILLIGIAGLLFTFHWSVGLALFAAVLPSGMMRIVSARQLFGFERDKAETERQAWYYHVVMTSLEFAKDLRLFGLGPIFVERYRELRDKLREGRMTITRRRTRYETITQIVAIVALYTTLAFMAFFAIQGRMTLGVIVMYFQAYQRAQGALQNLLQGLGYLYEDSLFLKHFYLFVDLPSLVEGSGRLDRLQETATSGLICRNVTFTYPSRNKPALYGIDLEILPSEIVALVGLNGAGKTTLAKLLCRLYDPEQGTISWEGQDLRDTDARVWRRQVSVVSQDVVLFDMTVGENIGAGDVGQMATPEALMSAAARAGADGMIRQLADGLDTKLGVQFGKGQELSVGERQRLALARACYRNSRLLILDEPSSAIDPLGEAEMIRSFRDMLGEGSALIISHRLSTVQLADRIYVIDEGRIVEQGSHAELMSHKGHYRRLYLAQSEHYQT